MENYKRVLHLLNQGFLDSALFVCENSLISNFHSINSYLKAKVLFAKGFHTSAISILSAKQCLPSKSLIFLCQIYIQIQNYEEAIRLLDKNNTGQLVAEEESLFNELVPECISNESMRLFYLSLCHHRLGNVEKCTEFAQLAYSEDQRNLELLRFLSQFQILPRTKLLSISNGSSNTATNAMHSSEFNEALKLNSVANWKGSLQITEQHYRNNLEEFIPLHLSNLFHLSHSLSLYKLGQWLFQNYPKHYYSYLAVGVYFVACAQSDDSSYFTERIENARKYFCKATLMNRTCPWSWEGFAHTFSLSFDSDQAIAAYSTLAKLIPSSPYPYLRIGIEYSKSDNNSISMKYLEKARELSYSNQSYGHLFDSARNYSNVIYNEIGCIYFKEGQIDRSLECFSLIQIDSGNVRSAFLTNKALALLASHNAESISSVVKLLERAIHSDPSKETHYAYCIVLCISNRIDEAMHELLCASEYKPNNRMSKKGAEIDESRDFFDYLMELSVSTKSDL